MLRVILRSLQVFAVDEGLDLLLDDAWLRLEERQLTQDLGNELLVGQSLSRLHDSDDASFDGYGPVFLDPVLVVRLLERRHWDTNLAHVRRELGVWGELIC